MDLVNQQNQFENIYLKDSNGDIFQAINTWVKDADKLISQSESRLNSSEALSSCLTGRLPDNLMQRRNMKYVDYHYLMLYIRESLAQIDDNDIKSSVFRTLVTSKYEKNLVFRYIGNLTEAQKARVRIISKLIWYNLYPAKE